MYFQGCRLCTEKLAESDATIGEYKDCVCTNDVRGWNCMNFFKLHIFDSDGSGTLCQIFK